MGEGIILLTNVQDFIIVVLAIYRKFIIKKDSPFGSRIVIKVIESECRSGGVITNEYERFGKGY
jgi:hypothetical protein